MSLLTATNGNVQLAAGALSDIPAGAFTLAVLWRRSGTTTDGFEALLALATAGGSVRTNLGLSAAAAPYEVRLGQGGVTRTFGFNDLADDGEYLAVVRRPAGTSTPRANLYRLDGGSPAWVGWADASGTVDDDSNTIGVGWLLNQPGGFPTNGGIWVAAVWNGLLDEAAVVHASTGLHIGVQQWLDIDPAAGPVALWRPGETDPVADESAAGTSDETSSSNVTITAGGPTGFNMAFGGGTVSGVGSVQLGALTATATGHRAVNGTATVSLGALAAAAIGRRTVNGQAAATLGAVLVTAAGHRTVHGLGAVQLGGLTVVGTGEQPPPARQLTSTVTTAALGATSRTAALTATARTSTLTAT